MQYASNKIHHLTDITNSKLTSSARIASLNDAVNGLVRNSIDASATEIEIEIDYTLGSCSVSDNGDGFAAGDLEPDGLLARPNCTSRTSKVKRYHGRSGNFLSMLSSLGLFHIISTQDGDTQSLWLSEKRRARGLQDHAASLKHPFRTQVKLHSLFSNLPVRARALAQQFSSTARVTAEFDRLKHDMVALILSTKRHISIIITRRNTYSRFKYSPTSPWADQNVPGLPMDSKTFVRLFKEADIIDNPDCEAWTHISATGPRIEIHLSISKFSLPHRKAQFVSLNDLPISINCQQCLYRAVNQLSAFPSADRSWGMSYTRRWRVEPVGCVDRWHAFVLTVNLYSSTEEAVDIDSFLDGSQDLLPRVSSVLTVLLEELGQQPQHTRDSLVVGRKRSLRSEQQMASVASSRTISEHPEFSPDTRVTTSCQNVIGDMLTGLPFHPVERAHNVDSKNTQTERAQLAQKIRSQPIKTGTNTFKDNHASSDANAQQYDNKVWMEAKTGKAMLIDGRTGMNMPSHPRVVSCHSMQQGDTTRTLENKCSLPVERRLPLQDRNSLQTSTGPDLVAPSYVYPSAWNDGQTNLIPLAVGVSSRVGTLLYGGYSGFQDSQRITKYSLQGSHVVGQVDRKFILAQVGDRLHDGSRLDQLVLIDQHAADERCETERLLLSIQGHPSVLLPQSLVFEVSESDATKLHAAQGHFMSWGVHYNIEQTTPDVCDRSKLLKVTSLPSAVAERCKTEPRIVIDMLRSTSWSDDRKTPPDTNLPTLISASKHSREIQIARCMATAPAALLAMVNSRACRGSIMFNDELTPEQCQDLLRRLGDCALPFQCAHGRPSMVLLLSLNSLSAIDALALDKVPRHEEQTLASTHTTPPHPSGRNEQQSEGLESLSRLSNNGSCARPVTDDVKDQIWAGPALNSIDTSRTFTEAFRDWKM